MPRYFVHCYIILGVPSRSKIYIKCWNIFRSTLAQVLELGDETEYSLLSFQIIKIKGWSKFNVFNAKLRALKQSLVSGSVFGKKGTIWVLTFKIKVPLKSNFSYNIYWPKLYYSTNIYQSYQSDPVFLDCRIRCFSRSRLGSTSEFMWSASTNPIM